MTTDDTAVGRRVRLLKMDDDPDPVPEGTEGTIRMYLEPQGDVIPYAQISVDWDNGRKLMMCVPPDEFSYVD